MATTKANEGEKLVALHVRIPEALHARLLASLEELRKKQPMANVSTAIREALDRGLPHKTKRRRA